MDRVIDFGNLLIDIYRSMNKVIDLLLYFSIDQLIDVFIDLLIDLVNSVDDRVIDLSINGESLIYFSGKIR